MMPVSPSEGLDATFRDVDTKVRGVFAGKRRGLEDRKDGKGL